MTRGFSKFYKEIGRKHVVVNLDPANEDLLYKVLHLKDLINS